MTASATATAARILRFGLFEVDLQSKELRKRGLRLKIQQKPFQFLEMLLERPGELVTRKEIADRLWPGVFVAYDRSLNTAVNALRRALGDSPRNPRFLETRQGLGYRFIAPIDRPGDLGPRPLSSDFVDSIAVLPFQGADAALDPIADQIAEEIIGLLSTAHQLHTVARSTAFRYREPNVDAAAVGRELNVRTVLTGRVGQRGDSLDVSVEMVEASTGWRLWGEQYDHPAASVASLGHHIARDVARKRNLQLHDKPRPVPAAGDREAYRDYLKGRYFYNKLTEDALRKSVAYYESALGSDPHYALAHSGLADAYCLFAFLDAMPSRDALARARQHALAALRTGDLLAEAHASLANIRKLHDWDWEGAEANFRKAIALNPDYAAAHHWFADHLAA